MIGAVFFVAIPSSFAIQLQKISFWQRKELPLVVFSFALQRIIFCAFHFQLRRAMGRQSRE
ncbi:MAG: hypothetical protein ACK46Y_18585 [Fluviicola sp.]|jgi:hypothetical protein